MKLNFTVLLFTSLISMTFAHADERSDAVHALDAEIERMNLLAEANAEIVKVLKSPKYDKVVRLRETQLRILMEADMRSLRSTSDWATASESLRRKALEAVKSRTLARLKYDQVARQSLISNLCLTPQDVNSPDSSCYMVLYSPTLILSD